MHSWIEKCASCRTGSLICDKGTPILSFTSFRIHHVTQAFVFMSVYRIIVLHETAPAQRHLFFQFDPTARHVSTHILCSYHRVQFSYDMFWWQAQIFVAALALCGRTSCHESVRKRQLRADENTPNTELFEHRSSPVLRSKVRCLNVLNDCLRVPVPRCAGFHGCVLVLLFSYLLCTCDGNLRTNTNPWPAIIEEVGATAAAAAAAAASLDNLEGARAGQQKPPESVGLRRQSLTPTAFVDPLDIAVPNIALKTNNGISFGGSVAANGNILILGWQDRVLASPDTKMGTQFHVNYDDLWSNTVDNSGQIARTFATEEMGCYQFQNVVGCIVLDLAGTYVLPTFDIIDADGDGRITQTEFNSGFNIVDKDGNGFVNRDEYGMSSSIPFDTLDILPSSRDNRLSREEWLLSSFDLDGNGVITREDHDPTTGRPLSVWAESPLLGTQQQIGTLQLSSVTSSSTFCNGKSVSTCYGIAAAAHRLMLAATGAASDASRYVQVSQLVYNTSLSPPSFKWRCLSGCSALPPTRNVTSNTSEPAWPQSQIWSTEASYGDALALEGFVLAVGAPRGMNGEGYVDVWTTIDPASANPPVSAQWSGGVSYGGWSVAAVLSHAGSVNFGARLMLKNGILAVAAPGGELRGSRMSSVHIYSVDVQGSTSKLCDFWRASDDFGASVDMQRGRGNRHTVVVGEPSKNRAYAILVRPEEEVKCIMQTLVRRWAMDLGDADRFGLSLAVSNQFLFVGAPGVIRRESSGQLLSGLFYILSLCTEGNYIGDNAACVSCGNSLWAKGAQVTTCSSCIPVRSTGLEECNFVCNSGYFGRECLPCSQAMNNSAKPSNSDWVDGGKTCSFTCHSSFMRVDNDCINCSQAVCPCDAGYGGDAGYGVVTGTGTCTACVAGKYKSAAGNGDCTDCVAGKYGIDTGQTTAASCTDCTPNSNSPAQSSSQASCTCNAGYGGNTGTGTCVACGAGKYKASSASVLCTDCGTGTYSSEGSIGCISCPSYSNSPVISISVTACKCNPGYSGPDGGTCIACGSNTYKSDFGSTCTPCPSDKPISLPASLTLDSCSIQCGVGWTGPDRGPCTLCEAGKFKTAKGSAPCSNCLAGSYAADSGTSECIKCNAGKYSTSVGASDYLLCAQCRIGTYSSTVGASADAACLTCPTSSDSHAGSSSFTNCTCNTGYWGAIGGICTPCEVGKFKNATGAGPCVACAVSSYSGAVGATACTMCPTNSNAPAGSAVCTCNPGFTGPSAGSCTHCTAGKFKDVSGSDACASCIVGKYGAGVGGSSETICMDCAVGTYSGRESASTCSKCEADRVAETEGSYRCIKCVEGKIAALNSSKCVDDTSPPQPVAATQAPVVSKIAIVVMHFRLPIARAVFTAEKESLFRWAVAATVKVPDENVTIVCIEEVAARRVASTDITTQIRVTDDTDDAALSRLQSSWDTNTLNTNLKSKGLPEATFASFSLDSSSQAGSKNGAQTASTTPAGGLGSGDVIGGVVGTVAVCCMLASFLYQWRRRNLKDVRVDVEQPARCKIDTSRQLGTGGFSDVFGLQSGKSAVELAAEGNYGRGHSKVLKVLCEQGARGALCYAAKKDLRDMLAELISKGHDLEECDQKYGRTALLWASSRGHAATVRVLVELGASLEAVDKKYGQTALMWASEGGHAATVRVLVELGASLEAVDKGVNGSGRTALLWASEGGHADTVRVLVELGASVEAVDKEYGQTALMWASEDGHADTVRVLVELGASLEAVDKRGSTALELALANDKEEAAAVLRAHGAQVSLFFAAEKGMTDEIAACIAAGQDVNARDQEGHMALELALENDQEEVAAVLRAHGAQVSLFFAAEKGMTDEIAACIAAGQDVNACNEEGRTALDLALANDHHEAASMLRSHNALESKQLKERMHKAWRDVGNVVVLEHVDSGALYEDYTMLFGNFNTFKTDVKLSGAKFYYELHIKHIQGVAQFGWATAGFKRSTEPTGEGIGDNAFSWAFDGVRVSKWGETSSGAEGEEDGEQDVPNSVSFLDTEGDTSTLRLDTATRQLSWHARGRCYLQNISIIEFDAARAAIIAPEHSALTARLVDPPAGLERDSLLRSIAVMARSANAVQLRGFKEISAFGVAWQEGDVLGLACDMVNKTVSFSVNGSFEPPLGLAFQNIAADSIAPAFTANSGFKVVANFGQLPLKHAPPDETYVSVHAAAQK